MFHHKLQLEEFKCKHIVLVTLLNTLCEILLPTFIQQKNCIWETLIYSHQWNWGTENWTRKNNVFFFCCVLMTHRRWTFLRSASFCWSYFNSEQIFYLRDTPETFLRTTKEKKIPQTLKGNVLQNKMLKKQLYLRDTILFFYLSFKSCREKAVLPCLYWIAALVWSVSVVCRKDVHVLLDLFPFSRVVKTGDRLQRSCNPMEKITSLCLWM